MGKKKETPVVNLKSENESADIENTSVGEATEVEATSSEKSETPVESGSLVKGEQTQIDRERSFLKLK